MHAAPASPPAPLLLLPLLLSAASALLPASLPVPVQLCSIHAKRVTIFVKDMQLARRLRGDRSGDYV